jgi:hypothetical protein
MPLKHCKKGNLGLLAGKSPLAFLLMGRLGEKAKKYTARQLPVRHA